MRTFIEHCDECTMDLQVTNNAWKECNLERERSNNTLLELSIVFTFVGYFLGRMR